MLVSGLNYPLRFCRTARCKESGWRRATVVSMFLIVLLCLLSVLISQQLVTTIPSAPFLTIGRSIQSWSSNEVTEIVNITQDIEDVLLLQRSNVNREMLRYKYPAGRYNVNAKNLRDLVPELGGNPQRSIIVTTWRSGSTFLGDVLNSIPGNYYHYEPLLDYGIVQVRGPPLANKALHNIHQLLNCNYTDLGEYLRFGQDHNWLFTHNNRLWDRCTEFQHLCWLPQFLNKYCSLFPFQSMKLVRLRLNLIEQLLEDPKLGIRVLLLVRDPRGTMQSRRHRDWCPGQSDCWDPALLCADLIADYSAAIRLRKRYPLAFRAVRYEDVSLDPYSEVEDILHFFGFDFLPSVKKFLDTHTKTDMGGVSSTFRNSRVTPFRWRSELSHKEVKIIQRKCEAAMTAWGYVKAFNATHQKSFTPIVKNFSLD